MAEGGPAWGVKGHITGSCLDTNVSSMNTRTLRRPTVPEHKVIKKGQMKRRITDATVE